MKKKILTSIISLFNCLCLVLLCTSLTGCAEETLSEADSQLFQIACEHMAQEALMSNEASTIKYASMVCNYDAENNKTKVVATIAPEISFIAVIEAVFASVFSFCITYSTRSTTIIASSTTRPIANINAKRVKILISNPSA